MFCFSAIGGGEASEDLGRDQTLDCGLSPTGLRVMIAFSSGVVER